MGHYILADCNNFYVSCERLFNPKLEGRSVIVLSNNDGCVVARSQEAKQLGIKMGEPYFKIEKLCNTMNVAVYSSNYQLYGDISQRVMEILAQKAPEIQIYSIDEAFLKYPATLGAAELWSICIQLRRLVKRWVGMPISLGIAPTKTLAKLANDLAKKNQNVGIYDLSCPEKRNKTLLSYPVGSVWGIGSRLQTRLNAMGIYTAHEFSQMDPIVIRQRMGVVGERMLWELRGISCLPIEEDASPKKSITCSRSFGKVITESDELANALATFVNIACVKLRRQNSCAQALHVFLEAQIEPQQPQRRQYGMTKAFLQPTSDTAEIISAAKCCLHRLYHEKERYKKCGIILLDLQPEKNIVPDLFLGGINPKRKAVMQTVDALNAHFGKNTVFFGAMGTDSQWKARSDRRSEYNTTSWNKLPIVYAKGK